MIRSWILWWIANVVVVNNQSACSKLFLLLCHWMLTTTTFAIHHIIQLLVMGSCNLRPSFQPMNWLDLHYWRKHPSCSVPITLYNLGNKRIEKRERARGVMFPGLAPKFNPLLRISGLCRIRALQSVDDKRCSYHSTLSSRGVAMRETDHFIRSCLLLGMVVAARCYTVEKGVSEVLYFCC